MKIHPAKVSLPFSATVILAAGFVGSTPWGTRADLEVRVRNSRRAAVRDVECSFLAAARVLPGDADSRVCLLDLGRHDQARGHFGRAGGSLHLRGRLSFMGNGHLDARIRAPLFATADRAEKGEDPCGQHSLHRESLPGRRAARGRSASPGRRKSSRRRTSSIAASRTRRPSPRR